MVQRNPDHKDGILYPVYRKMVLVRNKDASIQQQTFNSSRMMARSLLPLQQSFESFGVGRSSDTFELGAVPSLGLKLIGGQNNALDCVCYSSRTLVVGLVN
jgi:hypothetical protein